MRRSARRLAALGPRIPVPRIEVPGMPVSRVLVPRVLVPRVLVPRVVGRRILAVAVLVIAVVPVVAVPPLAAHHAMVMYDRLTSMTLVGTVVDFQWTNPHVFVLVDGKVEADDATAVWRLETSSPSNLVRLGWSATALRPGDRVAVTINPHHDRHEKNARLLRITLLDSGQELGTAYIDADLHRNE